MLNMTSQICQKLAASKMPMTTQTQEGPSLQLTEMQSKLQEMQIANEKLKNDCIGA